MALPLATLGVTRHCLAATLGHISGAWCPSKRHTSKDCKLN